ncbi:uncharacterized protein LOC111105160 [Crassostrea virginica]
MRDFFFIEVLVLQALYVLAVSSFSCIVTPCQNGGSCLEGKCVCPEGYYGNGCQDECDGPDTCNNHGACLGIPRRCICDVGYQLTGFYGRNCEDSCDPRLNGTCGYAGTCTGTPKRCVCQAGFHGTWCAACTGDDHCKHGGTCGLDGSCICRKEIPEITGAHCEEVCERDLDCMNGGKCLPDKTCKCIKFDDGFRCVSSDADIPNIGFITFLLSVIVIKATRESCLTLFILFARVLQVKKATIVRPGTLFGS